MIYTVRIEDLTFEFEADDELDLDDKVLEFMASIEQDPELSFVDYDII